MIKHFAFWTLLFLLAFWLDQKQHAHALADPDVIVIEQIRRYLDVSVAGDALFIVHYDLEYTVPPAEGINEGWIGRLIDVGGAGQLTSVAPQAHHLIPNRGYDHGVYSFYFTVAPVPAGVLTVTLEGNPALSPTPTGITSTSIEDRLASDLVGDMRLTALHFESIWLPAVDVITFVGGPGRLTADGENYFLAAVPNLAQYAPGLFSLGFIQPDPSEHIDAPDTAFQTARDAFWANTPLRDFTTSGAAALSISRTLFETILSLAIGLVLGGYMYKRTESQEIGIFVIILWIGVAAFMGLAPLALLYTLAFAAVFILAYLIFFRPSAA